MAADRTFLTDAGDFRDVSRGNPEAAHAPRRGPRQGAADAGDLAAGNRRRGRPQLARPLRLADETALDFAGARGAGQDARRAIPQGDAVPQHRPPAGPGLVGRRAAARGARLAGKIDNVRRVYYWGFHNNDPKQMFQLVAGVSTR